MDKSSINTLKSLKILWFYLSNIRRKQIKLLFLLMIITALVDLSSVGAIIPFLSIISNPEKLYNYKLLITIYKYLGFSSPNQILLPVTSELSKIVPSNGVLKV